MRSLGVSSMTGVFYIPKCRVSEVWTFLPCLHNSGLSKSNGIWEGAYKGLFTGATRIDDSR